MKGVGMVLFTICLILEVFLKISLSMLKREHYFFDFVVEH